MNSKEPDRRIRVLLLDGHTVQVLSVLKALTRTNFFITVFCETRISYGYASRYAHMKVLCPKVKKNEIVFLSFLKSFLSVSPQEIIIPLFDDSALLMNEHRDEFESSGVKIALPECGLFRLAFNKSLLMNFCKENNFSHPATEILNKDNLKKAGEKIGFPSLIKPVSSSGANGIVYLDSMAELENVFLKTEEQYGPAILQRYICHEGYYYNAMIYRSKEGIFSKVVIIRIRRYFPIKGGTGSFSETVEYPEIELLCKRILERMGWCGFADLDIITDKFTNEPCLIEINPRMPACIHASLVSGINFPLIIINDALGIPIPAARYHMNKKIRYLAMDFLWFIFSKERFKSNPSWFRFRDRDLFYQDGCEEIMPMIAGILMGLKKYMSKEYRQSKLQ